MYKMVVQTKIFETHRTDKKHLNHVDVQSYSIVFIRKQAETIFEIALNLIYNYSWEGHECNTHPIIYIY